MLCFLGLLGFTVTRAIPVTNSVSILAASFPLGYWVVGLLRGEAFGQRESAQAQLDITREAQLASYAVFVACIPFAIILTIAYGQFLTGFGFLFVSLGSIWIPSAYSSAARAKLLVLDGNHKEFFKSLGDQSYNAQKIAILFLVLMLGKRLLLQSMFPTLIYVFFLVALYLKGWLMLGAVGTYPAVLIGLMAPLLLLSRSFLSIRRMSLEERQSVSNMVFERIPSGSMVGGRFWSCLFSALALLVIASIFRI